MKPLINYFKSHRQQYYDHIQYVRESGDWEEWLKFFLKGVATTAEQAVETIQKTLHLFEKNENKIATQGKSSTAVMLIHHFLKKNPVSNSKHIRINCKITLPTTISSLNQLIKMDVIREITGKSRNKIYVYKEYLDILS